MYLEADFRHPLQFLDWNLCAAEDCADAVCDTVSGRFGLLLFPVIPLQAAPITLYRQREAWNRPEPSILAISRK